MASNERKLVEPPFKGKTAEEIMQLNMNQIGSITRSRIARKVRRMQGLKPKKIAHSEDLEKQVNHERELRHQRRTNRYKFFLEKVRKVREYNKKNASKPKFIKTHLRSMIIFPEMIGTTIYCHTGKTFIPIECKANMIGMYLGEFAQSYKMVKHGKAGIGATRGSSSTSLK